MFVHVNYVFWPWFVLIGDLFNCRYPDPHPPKRVARQFNDDGDPVNCNEAKLVSFISMGKFTLLLIYS